MTDLPSGITEFDDTILYTQHIFINAPLKKI